MDTNNLFKNLSENDVLIVDDGLKSMILKEKSLWEINNQKLLAFKMISSKTFLSLLTYSYDDEIYLHAIEKMHLPISIIEEMLHFLNYHDGFFDSLNEFKKTNEKFIHKNLDFLNFIKSKNLIFLEEPIYLKHLLTKNNLSYQVLTSIEASIPEIKKFSTKEQELFYLFEQIASSLKNGIKLEEIALTNVSESDYAELKRFSMLYQIPINFNENILVYDLAVTKKIIKYNLHKIKEILTDKTLQNELFQNEINANKDLFDDVMHKILGIFNKYPNNYSDDVLFKLFIFELKKLKIKLPKMAHAVNIISLDEISFSNHKRIYLIHAVYEVFPPISKDNAYLSDNDKLKINYPTSKDINHFMNEKYRNYLSSKNITYVSYAIKDKYMNYGPSDLILSSLPEDYADLKITDLKEGFIKSLYKYLFKNHISGKPFINFNPEFSLDTKEHKKMSFHLKQKTQKISPSAVINYIKSPFVYYLSHILYLSTFEMNVSTNIGNFFHTLVEVMYKIYFSEMMDSEDQTENLSKIEKYITESKKDIELQDLFEDIKKIYFENELALIREMTQENESINLDLKLAIETIFFVDKNKMSIMNALAHLKTFEENEKALKLYVEKEISYMNYLGRVDLIKIHLDDLNSFSMIDFKSSTKAAFSKDHMLTLLNTLDTSFDDKIQLNQLTLLQLLIYSYLFTVTHEKFKLRDVAYFSFLEDDLKFNSLQTKDLSKEHYTSTKTRVISEEELDAIYMHIESVLGEIESRIKNLDFNTQTRRSTNATDNLKVTDFSAYQAIAFYTKYSQEIQEDETDEDN